MTQPLSPREREALDFIETYIDRNAYPPSLKEIAMALGASSTSTAFRHVQALQAKGRIEVTGVPRGLRLVKGGCA